MTYNLIKQRLEDNDIIILDGAIGAEFLKIYKGFIEDPVTMML